MKTIEDHIQRDKDLLTDPTISSAARRHYKEELHELEVYADHHHDEIEAGASISTDSGLSGVAAEELETMSLSRLTVRRNKSGDVTSALAFDDLTGMCLDAGKVKEARDK